MLPTGEILTRWMPPDRELRHGNLEKLNINSLVCHLIRRVTVEQVVAPAVGWALLCIMHIDAVP